MVRSKTDIRSYAQRKSRRGRKRTVATHGFACPNACCDYYGITDPSIHALVGYGTHNGIQRFKCQACHKVFTSRVNTPLYSLKTDAKRVELVLWFLAEGVDVSVLVRFTGHADATLARWLELMGRHSQGWHNFLFRNPGLMLVQMDELYTRIRATASAAWLWLAFDPVSKAIPSLQLGGRTKDDAIALVHDFKSRLLPECIPAVTTDGLRSYFYALTAHFGRWFRPPKRGATTGKPAMNCIMGSWSSARANAMPPSRIHGWSGASVSSCMLVCAKSGSVRSFRPRSLSVSTSLSSICCGALAAHMVLCAKRASLTAAL
ncbi:MAG: IS1 family transposase [Chloroflexi bacterium]|nr:IS1 family transposase [Chloroflexota bacterium]